MAIGNCTQMNGTKKTFRNIILNAYYDNELKSAKQKDILLKLSTFVGRDGCIPSHETLAKAANTSRATVIRALNWAYSKGIVERTYRYKKVLGKRVRTSNSYRLIISLIDRAVVSSKYLARAVFNHLSCKPQQKVNKNIPLRGNLTYQLPQMTREEMIAWCMEQSPG